MLLTRLFPAAFASQRFFHALFLAGLQVVGVSFHFLDDVLLLHFALKAAQGVFERFTFLQSYIRQIRYTPRPVPIRTLQAYCKIVVASQEKTLDLAGNLFSTVTVPNSRHVSRTQGASPPGFAVEHRSRERQLETRYGDTGQDSRLRRRVAGTERTVRPGFGSHPGRWLDACSDG